ncbi:hypothetical protein [Clavibacter nebraskensis]|uniref:hypothetical protein n=1 Tax=Clavibacter nebraskensis TaxID=31963 RepID=UPI003F877EBF
MSHDVEPSPGAPDPAAPAAPHAGRAAERGVTPGVLLAAEWSWRLLVIGIAGRPPCGSSSRSRRW